MRRTWWIAPLLVGVVLAAVVVLRPASSPADAGKSGAGGVPALRQAAPPLPIGQVVLFSSGVGYFQREGEVEGNARVDLTFPAGDVNDLLKSLVLRDLNGGHVSAVSYDSHDPIDKTLKSFAINLTNSPSFGQILQQARGEKVEVVLQQSTAGQPGTLNGTVIGLEKQKQPAGKDGVIETEMLNLWCAEGIRSMRLADVQRLRFLNPLMESEVRRALDVLALSHDTQKKAVSLSFTGEGKRQVRVSYVIENPIWKTSYRLVLDKKGKPFLQGWAVVENPSDEDWNNVRMALVSGRPISFRMDLYQPLYVPRPVVEPELFASLRPPTYSGAMGDRFGAQTGLPAPPTSAAEYMPPPGPGGGGGGGGAPKKMPAPKDAKYQYMWGGRPTSQPQIERIELGESVASVASANEIGDFFQYAIAHPVSLPRQKSALLPIVNQDIEAAKVSIYNEQTHSKFPLLGLKLKNTTGMHLMQGPITVFEEGSYAGDSRILNLQPNEERLLSYAIDLGTEVEPVKTPKPAQRLTDVAIFKGLLYSTTKIRESKKYNIKNRSEHDRTLIVEHPYRANFKLVSKVQPSERARDVHRFELKVPAGKTATHEVIEEIDAVQQVVLSNSDDQTIQYFLTRSVSSDKVKDALKRALELKEKLSTTQRDLAHVQVQLKTITDDQTRLRANLKEMPPTAAAYKRYLEKFDKQETAIEEMQAQIKKLQDAQQKQLQEYEAYLAGLQIGEKPTGPMLQQPVPAPAATS